MNFDQLQFAYPVLLFTGLFIPIIWIVYFFYHQFSSQDHQLEKFIDKHLLPYLLVSSPKRKKSLSKTLVIWSLVWCSLTIALAGPRWSFREMETFSRDQSLVILLDLSESMNATDIKPSRLIRAKQKIEDLLHLSQGIKIGLIAFAADPHMITPITDDKETIRHLLPSLTTDLVYVQGSKLSPALAMASTILKAEPGINKAILVLSDGGFEDSTAIVTARKIAEEGIAIHVMGVGTIQGAPLPKNKKTIMSKLEKERLSEISKIGRGRYLELHYSDHEETIILQDLAKNGEAQINAGKKNRFWDEHFYLFILPILPFLLWWFRRGYIFAAFLILSNPPTFLNAVEINYFKNCEQQGLLTYEAEEYEAASQIFQDPYRRGVAYYKAGNYPEAEKMFKASTREEVRAFAHYNLGNALAKQSKFKEAIEAYQEALKQNPDYLEAKENLELIKKALEEQKNEDSSANDSKEENKSSNDQNQSTDSNKQQNLQSDKDKKDEKSDSSQDGQNQPEMKDQDNPSTEEKEENEKEQQNESGNKPENKENDEALKQTEEAESEAEETPANTFQNAELEKLQMDQDADAWLNRITNDPSTFLKNKFFIESKKNGTKEGTNPW